MIKYFFAIVVFAVCFLAICQTNSLPAEELGRVKWMTIEEAIEKNKQQPKAILIDVYTDWCGWCKHMMKTTFSNPQLASYINSYFYPVRFNAETKDTIVYLGEKYVSSGPDPRAPHQLAIKLLNGRMSYPSIVFSNDNFQFTLLAAGYMDVQKIEPLLVFTVEKVYQTTDAETFKEYFNKSFYNIAHEKGELLQSYTIEKAVELNKSTPKKTIVYLHADWCNSCKVMYKTTFNDSLNKAILNKDFYFVEFNITYSDTVRFYNDVFPPNKGNAHPFAFALSNNTINLPSVIIFGEEMTIIANIPRYFDPKIFNVILNYYKRDAYLHSSFEEYRKKYMGQ